VESQQLGMPLDETMGLVEDQWIALGNEQMLTQKKKSFPSKSARSV